jgi:hypothetical protein
VAHPRHEAQAAGPHYGLKIDTSRTTDTASVLRVAGTFNFKDRSKPREVSVMTPKEGEAIPEIGTGLFIAMLDKALIKAGVEAKVLPQLGGSAPDTRSAPTRCASTTVRRCH